MTNYKTYLQKDDRAKRIFSTIQNEFNNQDFPLSDFEQMLKQLDTQEALDMARTGNYDIILLDVMLPKLTGFEVCQQIREFSDVPIIMLTAKGDDMDKILGLEYGADDYITKPFNILEVKARIKAIIRRTGRTAEVEKVMTFVPESTISSRRGDIISSSATSTPITS